MKYKRWRTKTPVLSVTQFILLMIAVALPFVQRNFNAAEQWDNDLRELKVQRSQLARALHVINDHRHVVQATDVGSDTVETITLSLIEAIKHQALAKQLELTKLTVTQSDDLQMDSASNASIFHALRVKLEVATDRAMTILPLFDAIKDAAGWRPIEIRGCSLVRLSVLPVSLHAACSVDVYYFPAIDK